MPRITPAVTIVLTVIIAFILGRWTSPARGLLATPEGAAFVGAFNTIEQHHLNPASAATLARGATQGLLKGLNDPFTLFVPSDQAQVLEGVMRDGSEVGTGVQHHAWREDDTGDQITEVPPGSPGARAGLRAGDVILSIDGHDVSHLTLDQVARYRIGPAGTAMHWTILRDNRTLEVTVMRERVQPVTVTQRLLEPGIGLIRINDFFSAGILEQFRSAVSTLQRQGVRALVIDLRDNGGGLIEPAAQIADALLGQGVILTTRDRNGQTKITHRAKASADDLNWPLVLLTNRNTASASEILVSALRDAKRATVIGQATHGKGVANAQVKLEDGSLLFVPVVEWLNTAGQSLRGKGIKPDRALEDTRFAKPLEIQVLGTARTAIDVRIGTLRWQGQTDAQGRLELERMQQISPSVRDAQLELAIKVLRDSIR
jgi:carboxyl-terminal processing protease